MLMNYVELERDIPKRLHFTDHYYVEGDIWDKDLNKMKWVRRLIFWCDEEDEEPSAKTFSVLAQGLLGKLEPYLKDHDYRGYDFVITKRGERFVTQYSVEVIPRPES